MTCSYLGCDRPADRKYYQHDVDVVWYDYYCSRECLDKQIDEDNKYNRCCISCREAMDTPHTSWESEVHGGDSDDEGSEDDEDDDRRDGKEEKTGPICSAKCLQDIFPYLAHMRMYVVEYTDDVLRYSLYMGMDGIINTRHRLKYENKDYVPPKSISTV